MLRLVAPAVAAVAVTFGMARYGYGLFLPDLRAEFGLSTEALGLLATGSTGGYLVATTAVAPLVAWGGPRLPVVLGCLAAAGGTATVGLASGVLALSLGVIAAGASPALVLPPFSEAVTRLIRPEGRDRALTVISSGTSYGVLLAGPIALFAGGTWRVAWLIFAGLALVTLVWNARVLPGPAVRGDGPSRRSVLNARTRPLLGAAFLVGVGLAVYFTFAVDLVVEAGSLGRSSGGTLLVAIGGAGIVGGVAGDLVARSGLARVLRGTAAAFAFSLVLLPLGSSSLPAVVVSALLFGASFIALTGVLAVWSGRAVPERPDAALAAMLFLLFVGQLIGPALAGVLGGTFGLASAFYLSAALVAGIALLAPREAGGSARPGQAP